MTDITKQLAEALNGAIPDMLVAADLLSDRWKARNAEVGKRLAQHVVAIDAALSAYTASESAAAQAGTVEGLAVPPGMALVPLHPTRDMERVMAEEDWQWSDLLASTGTVSEEDCNEAERTVKESLTVAQTATVAEAMTEEALVKCLVASGCVGTVKMTFESGPYDITRPSINASRLADTIAAALASRAAPEGWQWVPKEPTERMRQAGAEYAHCGISANAVFMYRAMLAAAHQPPSGGEG